MAVSISQFNSAIAPDAGAASTGAGSASPLVGLQPGAVIEARVLALLENGQVRLAVGNALIAATTQIPLPVGATVQLAVQNTGSGTTLQFVGQIIPQAADPQTVPAQVASQNVAQPPVATTSQRAAMAAAPAAVAVSAPPEPAAADGAGAASLASAFPVVTAVATTNASAAANPATSPIGPPDLPVTVAPQLVPAPTVDAAVALQVAVRTAAVTQNSLSPLYAEMAVAVDLPGLPEPVQRQALRLLSLRPALDRNFTADDVKQAFANSGLLLEARMAENVQPSAPRSVSTGSGSAQGAATQSAATAAMTREADALPASDLKAALIVFRQVLAAVLAEGEGVPTTSSPPLAIMEAATGPAEQLAQVSDPGSAPPAMRSSVAGSPAPAANVAAPRATQVSPPPPFRDGPMTPQPPVIATLDATTPPRVAVQTLMAATDGALARQTLLQAASLPASLPSHLDSGGPRWNFEVPFAVPQGPHIVTNVAQFEISRDGKAATPLDESCPTWRARFSIDVDPIGRVHAQIGLHGVRAAVTLWAENPEGAARLRAGAVKLGDALRAAELDAGNLVVRDGAPRARSVAAGHFLDRAS